jgi:hypothetical protein
MKRARDVDFDALFDSLRNESSAHGDEPEHGAASDADDDWADEDDD